MNNLRGSIPVPGANCAKPRRGLVEEVLDPRPLGRNLLTALWFGVGVALLSCLGCGL